MKDILSAVFVPSTDSHIFYLWITAAVISYLAKFVIGKSVEKKYKFLINAPNRDKVAMLWLSVLFSISLIVLIYSTYSVMFKYIEDKWLFLAAKANLFLITLSLGIGPTINSFWLFLVKHSDELTGEDDFKEFIKSTKLYMDIESFCLMLSMLSLLGFFCILAIGI